MRKQLREAAPDGIDVYFDNVGGEHLEAALVALEPHGRVALCGVISLYNDSEPMAGPRNLALVVGKRLTLRGFIVIDHQHRMRDMLTDVSRGSPTASSSTPRPSSTASRTPPPPSSTCSAVPTPAR